MNFADLINGLYELLGGFFCALNAWRLYKEKDVKGISPWTMGFFWSWGFWNLYFYPAYGAWWSFVGGLFVCVSNTTWMVYYAYLLRRKPGHNSMAKVAERDASNVTEVRGS